MDKHAKCIYYFPNVFSQIKTQTWCFQIYSLWSWNMRWAFTRSSETVKQPALFLCPCMIFARAWASHAHRPWQISFSPSLQMFRFSVGSWSTLKYGLIYDEKVPFLWSIIYPANFDTFNGHLELVPSGISPLIVFFFLPSMRRYRIEYFALYAVLATK